MSSVVATVTGDCTNDAPAAQRAAATSTASTAAAAAAGGGTARMLMLCRVPHAHTHSERERAAVSRRPDNLRHRLRRTTHCCRRCPPPPTQPGYIINYGGRRDVRMRDAPASISNRIPKATAATSLLGRHRVPPSSCYDTTRWRRRRRRSAERI